MNSSASVHRLPQRGPVRRRLGIGGFTLLELLAVIAIIAVLTGIVIGVGRRASESGKIARAKAELAVLSAALESYKRQYGDYPQAGTTNRALTSSPAQLNDANVRLFHALTGSLGPTLRPVEGRSWIELAKFTLEEGQFSQQVASATLAPNALLDPWGNRYVYYYRDTGSGTAWTAQSYVLYSVGPDGAAASATEANCHLAPAGTGIVNFDDARNADNIYANRN